MTFVQAGLLAQLVLAGFAVLAAAAAPDRMRSLLAGGASAAVGIAGAVTGAAVIAGSDVGDGVQVNVALPVQMPLTLAPDGLGAVFLLIAGAVGALAALYGIGYASGPAASRSGWAAFAVFLLGMQMVPAAADVVSFLLAWELMALGSTVLLLADHRSRREVLTATTWYAVMTHASFVLLLAGFAVLVSASGSTAMADLGATGAAADAAFVLLVAGFAVKAGLVPVHVWLPMAHPEAPSHVSAAMSAAMVKMGVYGLLLVSLRLLPDGPRWWGVLLLALALASALYGILQASVATDLKRLLAYSTTENVGLIAVAVAVAMLLRGDGQDAASDVARTAALLLAVSHAAFKTVLFLSAGSILHATGERDLDRMGGLAAAMPVTSAAFGVAALGAAALPVTSGFAAEWVLLQSLINGDGRNDVLLAVLLPIAVAVVALTAGLALLTFVKAYGIAMLARPRSDAVAHAHEAGGWMRTGMLVGAVAVLVIGLVPGPVADALGAATGTSPVQVVGLLGISLPDVDALLDPIALAVLAATVALPVVAVHLSASRQAPRVGVDLAWGCGGARVSPRMQYTATSYAEPLVRVFDDALRPTRDLQISHADEARFLVSRVTFAQRVSDRVADRVYKPGARLMLALGDRARRIQNGSIHRYLAFSFTALVLVLLAVALLSTVIVIALQIALAVALTPVLVGAMRQTRARMEGREGAGVLQPWRDVRKLLAKHPLSAAGTGPLLVAAPLLLAVSSLVVVALVPLVSTATLPLIPDDLFVVVSVLLLGTVALALVGLESGTAFGGMGSSRHMMIAALVEPTVLVAVYALSIPVGTSALSAIVDARIDDPASVISPVGMLSVVALAIAVIAETGRLPVDNPSTHLELTMVHEAMVLESSGRDLAWLEVGSWLRLTALLGLVVNLVLPWGVATTASLPAVLIGIAAISAKLLLAGTALAACEVFLAKLRLFRVPELLAGSFVLAFLSVTASYLVA